MNARVWLAAERARTLLEAHDALVALRPLPEAARLVWVSYYRRSAAVYRHVADVDSGHHGHAVYWADRETAKAELLASQSGTSGNGSQAARHKRRKTGDAAQDTMLLVSSLEDAHQALNKMRPGAQAGTAAWLAYYQHAAAVYIETAEVDRAHHHEALFYAALERRNAARLSGQVDESAEADSTSDSAHPQGGRPW